MNIMRHKKEGARARFGRSLDTWCDIGYQLRRYIEQCWLAPAPTCTRQRSPHRQSIDQLSLFPRAPGRDPNAFNLCRQTSPKAFTDMVVAPWCGVSA